MPAKMEHPAMRSQGVPVHDLAGASIEPENTHPLRELQARRLTRRCAISMALAVAVSPLVHGGPA
jgi:hypothetical protein